MVDSGEFVGDLGGAGEVASKHSCFENFLFEFRGFLGVSLKRVRHGHGGAGLAVWRRPEQARSPWLGATSFAAVPFQVERYAGCEMGFI
jgi:hypothetical protein